MKGYSEINKNVMISLTAIIAVVLTAMIFNSGITGGFLEKKNAIDPTAIKNSLNTTQTITATPAIAEPVCVFVKEEYTELEPYTEEQCVSIPSVNKTCSTIKLSYSIEKKCYWSNDLKTLNSVCTVKNIDSQTGAFTVDVGVITTVGKVGENKSIEINPLTTGDVTYSYDTDLGNCYCTEITIPTKEVCYDKIVNEQQCFDVTKYDTVIKTREIKKCN